MDLPADLKSGIERLAQGKSRRAIAQRAEAMSLLFSFRARLGRGDPEQRTMPSPTRLRACLRLFAAVTASIDGRCARSDRIFSPRSLIPTRRAGGGGLRHRRLAAQQLTGSTDIG